MGNYKYRMHKNVKKKKCALSPDICTLYSEIIMKEIKDRQGIQDGGCDINNLRHESDTVLIAKDLQQLLYIVETAL